MEDLQKTRADHSALCTTEASAFGSQSEGTVTDIDICIVVDTQDKCALMTDLYCDIELAGITSSPVGALMNKLKGAELNEPVSGQGKGAVSDLQFIF